MEEINLKSLLNYYLERVKLIAICTLIFFLVGIVYTAINRPKYISESVITVTGDLNTAKNQSTSYANQVTNNTVLQTVISDLDLKTSVKTLKNNITATSETTSDSIYITVENSNSKKAMDINANLNRVFINYIQSIYGNDKLKISSEATITGGGVVKKYAKQVMMVTLVGAILGVIYIFIKFYFDNSIKSEDDIKSLKLDIFGVILSDITEESYKNVIDNITTKTIGKDNKVLLFTTTDEESDKNLIIFTLASMYSDLDKKVLIIDADLKEDNQATIFDVKAKSGYTDIINAKTLKIDSSITKTKNKKIDLITNGSKTLNPVEILSSTKNEKVLNDLKSKYDVILISTPPVIGTNGTLELSKYTDLNILVATHEKTLLNDVKESIDNYTNNELKLNGIIINDVDTKINNYSKYYTKNYFNK